MARPHALMAGPPRWDGDDEATRVKTAMFPARHKWQAPQDLREAPLLTTAGADAPPTTAPEPATSLAADAPHDPGPTRRTDLDALECHPDARWAHRCWP